MEINLIGFSFILSLNICFTLSLLCRPSENQEEDISILCEGEGGYSDYYLDLQYQRISTLIVTNSNISILSRYYINRGHNSLDTDQLYLKNLHIKDIEADTFQEITIRSLLDLSKNQIYRIIPFVFKNQEILESLYLNNNLIGKLNEYSFSGLKLLKHLSLNNNNIRMLGDDLFLEQVQLTYLFLNENKIKNLELSTFRTLSNLLILNLEKNHIEFIPAGCFDELKLLENLNLAFNNLSFLENQLFFNLENLQILNLNNNNLHITGSDVFTGLISLTKLFINSNNIENLTKGIFRDQIYLEYINASFNPLTHISKNAFTNLRNLNSLDLSFTAPNDQGFLLDISLSKLSLRNSLVEAIDFDHLVISEEIDMRYNHIDMVKNVNKLYASIVFLDFNKVSEIGEDFNDSLVQLTLSYNKLHRLHKNTFSNCINLKLLDLSYNTIGVLDEDIFENLGSLNILNLNGNIIQALSHGIFRNLKKLRTLNLSNNKIVYFPTGVFHTQENLQVLNISYNRIKEINEFTLYSLKSVQVLFLDHNAINKIDVNHLLDIKSLTTISLDGNSWFCTDLLNLLKALEKNKIYVLKGSTYLTHHVNRIACNHTDINLMTTNKTNQRSTSNSHYNLIDQSTEHSIFINETYILPSTKLNLGYRTLNKSSITRLNESLFNYLDRWSVSLNNTLIKYIDNKYLGLILHNNTYEKSKSISNSLDIHKINQTLYSGFYKKLFGNLNSSFVQYFNDKFFSHYFNQNVTNAKNQSISNSLDVKKINQTLYLTLFNKLFSSLNSSLLHYFNENYFIKNITKTFGSEKKTGYNPLEIDEINQTLYSTLYRKLFNALNSSLIKYFGSESPEAHINTSFANDLNLKRESGPKILKENQTSSMSSGKSYIVLVVILILLLVIFIMLTLKILFPYFKRYQNKDAIEVENREDRFQLIDNEKL